MSRKKWLLTIVGNELIYRWIKRKFIFFVSFKCIARFQCISNLVTVKSVSPSSKDLPVIVGGHGSDWLRDGLVHVVETRRLDWRQPVVVASTTTATTDRIRRSAGWWTYGCGWRGKRSWCTVLLVKSSASSSTTSTTSTPALVSQFLFTSPFCSTIAKPHLQEKFNHRFQFILRRVIINK